MALQFSVLGFWLNGFDDGFCFVFGDMVEKTSIVLISSSTNK